MTTYTWTDNAMQGGTACDVDKVNDNLMYLKYDNIPAMSTIFALNSGNLSNGGADILSYSGTTLSFKVGGSYDDLLVTYADKEQETLTSLTNIENIPNYLPKYSSILPTMTSNTTPNGYVAWASSQWDSNSAAYKAYDKNTDTIASSSPTGTPYENKITLPVAKVAKYAKFTTGTPVPNNSYIYGSNDGGITKTVLYNNPQAYSLSSTTYFIKLDNETSYLTYGMYITSNFGGDTCSHIRELDFYELDSSGSVVFDGKISILKEKENSQAIATVKNVTQSQTFPASPVNGDYHCLTATGLQTYKRVSDSWVETQYVFIGTVIVSGGIISSVSTNSYNQNGYNVNFQTLGYRFPDLTKTTSITANTLYTASVDGWLFSSTSSVSTIIVTSPINKTLYNTGAMPIPKGTIYTSSIEAIFYPAKGAN